MSKLNNDISFFPFTHNGLVDKHKVAPHCHNCSNCLILIGEYFNYKDFHSNSLIWDLEKNKEYAFYTIKETKNLSNFFLNPTKISIKRFLIYVF